MVYFVFWITMLRKYIALVFHTNLIVASEGRCKCLGTIHGKRHYIECNLWK